MHAAGGAGGDIGEPTDAVDRLLGPPGGDEDSHPSVLADELEDPFGFEQTAVADLAARETSLAGGKDPAAPTLEDREGLGHRRVGEHVAVHGRCDPVGFAEVVGQEETADEVVGEAGAKPGDVVGRRRVEQQQIRPVDEIDVVVGATALEDIARAPVGR